MGKYFRLNTYISFECNGKNACIYNLASGDMILLDEIKADIIRKCENYKEVSELNDEEVKFLDELEKMGIGRYYDEKVYIEKMILGQDPELESTMKKNIRFSRLFLEITNECNLACSFCNYLDENAYRKTGCKRWISRGRRLSIEDYKDIIKQSFFMGTSEIVFIGGEPLLEYKKIIELMRYAKSIGIERFTIYSNIILLNNDILESLSEFNVKFIIEVFSNNSKEFKQICNKDIDINIYEKLKLLIKNNIEFEVKLLVCKENEDNIENILNELKNILSGQKIQLDFVYPHNKIHHAKKYIDYLYNKKAKLFRVSLGVYSTISKYNNCFANQIAVTLNGDVLPCIMTRRLSLGCVFEKSLCDIVTDGRYENLQCLSRSKVEDCKQCVYRFGCIDCRAIELEATNKINRTKYCECVSER